ncbi:MAG: HAMP domain-containing histidine kinase [Anaerolineae bacterium]|nr:HAMP domain-containing histidine kinase [Anaerolineae bacterium]
MKRSLGARLAVVYGLTSVVVVAALGVGVYLLTEHYLLSRAEDDLAALAGFYAAYTAALAPDADHLAGLAPQIAAFAPQAGYDVRFFDAQNGTLLAATRDLGLLPSRAARAELGYRQPSLFLPVSRDLPARRYVARAVPSAGGQHLVVVEVSRDVSDLDEILGVLRLILIGAGGLAVVVVLVASLLLAQQMTRPLREMELATRAIAAGDFNRRLGVHRADEIGRLAASVEQMTADLARLEASRREFIAKISHDLRTPLTAIKGAVINLQDTAQDEMQPSLAMMDEQAERLIRLVDDLLTLSRLQRGELRLRRAEVDLRNVVRAAVDVAGGKAMRLGVALALDLPDRLPVVLADADRLQQVIVNLLDNALRVTPPGGAVEVRVTGGRDAVALSVWDQGAGLSDEVAGRAFEPYVRGPGGDTGLGLTIAREIVEAHDGHIWLKPRPEGGAEAGFALPLG